MTTQIPLTTTVAEVFATLIENAATIKDCKAAEDKITEWTSIRFFFDVAPDEQIVPGANSRPFVILRAWQFQCETLGSRIGLELAEINGDVYSTSLPLDSPRRGLVKAFLTTREPIGPCQFRAVLTNYERWYIAIVDWIPPRTQLAIDRIER